MRLKVEQLDQHLKQSQQFPFYWIAGDETLVVQETLAQLRHHFRSKGFQEWELFFVDRSFNWQSVMQSGNNLSLFADKKIMELRLQIPRLDEGGRNALMEYLTDPNPDNVMILVTPRIEPASLNTKWFKSLESAGAFMQIWPVDAHALPRWINNRMSACGIRADQETIALLADRVEGNLLAAEQEITKLKVLTGASSEMPINISRKQVMNLVADSSKYNVFSLIDSALLGDSRRCLKILTGLRSEGSELLGILAILTRELRILIAISHRISGGQSISNAMQQERIRKTHEAPVSAAMKRLSSATLQAMLQHARLVDQSAKGLANTEPWSELTTILLNLCGTPLRLETRTN